MHIADLLIDKYSLFAQQNLETDEFALYLNIYRHPGIEATVADLLIDLQAPTRVLLSRLRKRRVEAEQAATVFGLNTGNTGITILIRPTEQSSTVKYHEYAIQKRQCHLDHPFQ